MDLLAPSAHALDVAAAVAHYREHGWAKVGLALSEEGAALLRARAEEIMLGKTDRAGLFFQKDTSTGRYDDLEYKKGWQGPGLFYRKIEKLETDPVFWRWIQNPLFERVARAVIGDHVSIYRATLFSKSAPGGTELPWHQDAGSYWGLSRDPELQIWTALDDAPVEAGCVEILPGSHRYGLATPLGGVVPDDRLRGLLEGAKTVLVPARAGEVILIHNYVWHRSGTNATGRPRRAFTVCLMDAATRCLRRKRAPRSFVRVFGAPA